MPIFIYAFLSSCALALSVIYVPDLIAGTAAPLAHWLGDKVGSWGPSVLRWIMTLVSALIGLVVALWLTPPLSAPALERLILLRERELGMPPRASAGFFRELSCALQAQLVALLVIGPVWFVLWGITLLAPPLATVTVPLKFLAFAWLLAWSLLDYPLSLRGVALSERLALMRNGLGAVSGFGAALSVLFAVPFFSLLLLPVAVVAAAELGAALEAADDA